MKRSAFFFPLLLTCIVSFPAFAQETITIDHSGDGDICASQIQMMECSAGNPTCLQECRWADFQLNMTDTLFKTLFKWNQLLGGSKTLDERFEIYTLDDFFSKNMPTADYEEILYYDMTNEEIKSWIGILTDYIEDDKFIIPTGTYQPTATRKSLRDSGQYKPTWYLYPESQWNWALGTTSIRVGDNWYWAGNINYYLEDSNYHYFKYLLSTVIHEHGHVRDVNEKKDYLDAKSTFRNVCWNNRTTQNGTCTDSNFSSSYAKTTRSEDYAETFAWIFLKNNHMNTRSKLVSTSDKFQQKIGYFPVFTFYDEPNTGTGAVIFTKTTTTTSPVSVDEPDTPETPTKTGFVHTMFSSNTDYIGDYIGRDITWQNNTEKTIYDTSFTETIPSYLTIDEIWLIFSDNETKTAGCEDEFAIACAFWTDKCPEICKESIYLIKRDGYNSDVTPDEIFREITDTQFEIWPNRSASIHMNPKITDNTVLQFNFLTFRKHQNLRVGISTHINSRSDSDIFHHCIGAEGSMSDNASLSNSSSNVEIIDWVEYSCFSINIQPPTPDNPDDPDTQITTISNFDDHSWNGDVCKSYLQSLECSRRTDRCLSQCRPADYTVNVNEMIIGKIYENADTTLNTLFWDYTLDDLFWQRIPPSALTPILNHKMLSEAEMKEWIQKLTDYIQDDKYIIDSVDGLKNTDAFITAYHLPPTSSTSTKPTWELKNYANNNILWLTTSLSNWSYLAGAWYADKIEYFFLNSNYDTFKHIVSTVIHENGHVRDASEKKNFISATSPFRSICWNSSIGQNSTCSDTNYVSDYSDTSRAEDFAETFSWLLLKNNHMHYRNKLDPNSAKFQQKIATFPAWARPEDEDPEDPDTDLPDTTKPTITLLWANPQIIQLWSGYIELGATANDNKDWNITAKIIIHSGAVNLAQTGEYQVIYTVADTAGNTGEAIRAVKIQETIIPDPDDPEDPDPEPEMCDRQITCIGLPTSGERNTVPSYTGQISCDITWPRTQTGIYSTAAVTNGCHFKCANQNDTRNGSACVSNWTPDPNSTGFNFIVDGQSRKEIKKCWRFPLELKPENIVADAHFRVQYWYPWNSISNVIWNWKTWKYRNLIPYSTNTNGIIIARYEDKAGNKLTDAKTLTIKCE